MIFKNYLVGYRLVFSEVAKKELSKLDKPLAKKIEHKLTELVQGKENLDIKKLAAYKEPTYRLRIGDVRIIYALWHEQLIVYVIQVGHRKEIYER